VDLLLSVKDTLKFDLVTCEVIVDVYGYKSEATLVKMLPPLLVKFSLRDTSGTTVERIASLDIYVNKMDLEQDYTHFAGVVKKLNPSESPVLESKARKGRRAASAGSQRKRAKRKMTHP
jgi:hypothetical protein